MRQIGLSLALAAALASCGETESFLPDGSSPVDAAADAAAPADAPQTQPSDAADAAPVDASATLDARDDARGDGETAADARDPSAVDLRFDGVFPIKVLAHGRRFLVVLEKPVALQTGFGRPSRSVRWMDPDGRIVWSRGSSGGRHLLDAAVHPSGQTTLLFGEAAGFFLERTDGDGRLMGTQRIADPLIDADAPAVPPANGPIARATFDVGRIASIEDDVVVATRTGRNSVVAYRYGYIDGDDFPLRYRTLVAPPLAMPPIGLTGGTYDTFGLVGAQYAVHVAAGPDGITYVGVRYPEVSPRSLLRVHQDVFGESLVGDEDALDSYVTRLSASGQRLGTSVVTTDGPDELQGLYAVAGAAWVAGRTETWNPQGTGHDAFVARIDAATGAVDLQRLDVDRGDIAFAAAPYSEGSVVVAGVSGYVQNPHGASVSEAANGFVRVIGLGGVTKQWSLPHSARHDEARTLLSLPDGRVLVAGMVDGPGTHSADDDPSRLRADGFIVTLP